jgi:surface protein
MGFAHSFGLGMRGIHNEAHLNQDPAFIFTVDTTKAGSAADTFILPTTGTGYNAVIEWEPGVTQVISGTPGNVSHTYATSGVKQIKITGTFPRIYFNNGGDKLKLMSIDNWGSTVWKNMSKAFYSCTNMVAKYKDTPNTVDVTDMSYMFNGCSNFNGKVRFNTSKVTNMQQMFTNCSLFNQSVSTFDTSNVTNMQGMFNLCDVFNQSLLHFNTSKVTSMSSMLAYCANINADISGWDLSLVTTMSNMMLGTSFSSKNYNKFLRTIDGRTLLNTVPFHAGYAQYFPNGEEQTNRDYLINTKGWTITHTGTSPVAFNKANLVLTFDDGVDSTYINGFPIFQNKGVKGTFYIVSDQIGNSNRMTWSEVLAMHNAGQDMQCHSKDHVSLNTLNQAQLLANLQAVNDAFIANGLPAPTQLAYPSGQYSTTIAPWVATMRHTGRKTSPGFVLFGADKIALKAEGFDNINDAELEATKILIDQAIENQTTLILFSHGVSTGDEPYTIHPDKLSAIIDYALSKASGIDIITMSELDALMT